MAQGPPAPYDNSPRVHELIRAGNLYLSLDDALALAIENNLDVELERLLLPQAEADSLRARGGGTLRGLNYILAETPAGVGGPLSPVPTNAAAAGRATSGTSVASNALELGALSVPQANLSMQGGIPQSNGTPVPNYDPALVGQLNWTHLSAPQTAFQAYGTNALVTNTTLANAGISRGFSTGGTATASFNNSHTITISCYLF